MKDETSGTTNYAYTERQRKLNGTGVFFLITTLIFLGAGIYLFATGVHKTHEAAALNTELTSSETRYTDLDSRYSSALAEIETYKGKNATLDSVLSIRENNIKELRSNLGSEKKKRQLSESEYKTQLGSLNNMLDDLNKKIDELQKQNGMLTVQRDSLGNNLAQTQTKVSELTTTNTQLSQKVTVASLLIPSNLTVEGVRDRSSGKESETDRASKVQHLKICFDVPQNKVADAGEKTFLIRILSPEGSVLAIQDQGSGTFASVETNEQMQYTTAATVDYKAEAQKDVCVHWSQSTPFVKGNYNTEVYQDGYLIGKESFELK